MIVRAPRDWRDIATMAVLAKKMHGEGAFRDLDYSDAKVAAIGGRLLDDPNYFGVLCEDKDEVIGLMVCYVAEFYFGNDLIATDMIVYVDKSKRGSLAAMRMIKRYVDWALKKGAKEIQLGQTMDIDPTLVLKLYSHAGFKLIGQLYKWRPD